MALTAPSFPIPPAITARNYACVKNGGDESVIKAIASAILTAVDGGLFTCTASMSGYGSLDVQNAMNALSQLGYTVSLSSTTLTVSW